MRFPIIIGLHRSFLLRTSLVGFHIIAFLILLIPPWPEKELTAFVAALAISLALGWRKSCPGVTDLRLMADGQIECRLIGQDEFVPAELMPMATAHPFLVVLKLRVDGKQLQVVVLPDSTTRSHFRRLRVWLRWRPVVRKTGGGV